MGNKIFGVMRDTPAVCQVSAQNMILIVNANHECTINNNYSINRF